MSLYVHAAIPTWLLFSVIRFERHLLIPNTPLSMSLQSDYYLLFISSWPPTAHCISPTGPAISRYVIITAIMSYCAVWLPFL